MHTNRASLPRPGEDNTKQHAEVSLTELDAAADAAYAEIGRADAKAFAILGFAGTAFSVLAAVAVLASALNAPARIGLGLGATLLAGASLVALRVIRPRLPKPAEATGFMAYAFMNTPEEVLQATQAPPHERGAADVLRLAKIARVKHLRLQKAFDLMSAALVIVALSLAAGLL